MITALKRLFIFALILSLCNWVMAQKITVSAQAERMDASANHASVADTIITLLKNNSYTEEEKLSLQKVFVHQLIALQKWDTCIQYCQQQINLAQKNNTPFTEATFYQLLGNTYYNLIKKDKALEYWQQCIRISEKNNFSALLEHVTHNIGVYYLELHRTNEAEAYLLRSMEISRKNNTLNSAGGNLHYRVLATLYASAKQFGKAEKLYQEVIKNSREMKDSTNLEQALSFFSLLLIDEGKITEALQYSDEAVKISSLIKTQDLSLTTLRLHAGNLAAAGKWKDAYWLMRKVHDSTVQMFESDIATKIGNAEAQFRNAQVQNEKEIALLKAKKENQLYLLSALALLGIVTLVFYQYYQRKSARQKVAMQLQVKSEKERLSRDLHDNLGSQMTLLSNNLETLTANYKKQNEINDNIDTVKETSRQLLQTLRETIWILNKEEVTAEEFFDKTVDYAHRYIQQYGNIQLQVEEHLSESKTLTDSQALQLFRICQEAITNACKYSDSSILLLKAHVNNAVLQLTVKDFGKGFDDTLMNRKDRYGILNMKQRAASIGAAFEINSQPGGGTVVEVRL